MKIHWKIEKKRGNIRPVLTYSFTVESYEKNLALPPIRILSSIAEPVNSWQEHCYPQQFERAEKPEHQGYYHLEIVSHKGGSWSQTLRLPWRENNEYPEIEDSFEALREAFEQELRSADASEPMDEARYLSVSTATIQSIAPAVLAERFLDFAKKSAGAV